MVVVVWFLRKIGPCAKNNKIIIVVAMVFILGIAIVVALPSTNDEFVSFATAGDNVFFLFFFFFIIFFS